MPVLQAEPTTFPAGLFDSGRDSLNESGRKWWVLQTKPKQEKAVAREHLHRGIPFFLPTTRRQRLNRRGEKSSFIPLFPGYVFGFATDAERFEINRTGRLVSFISVPNQEKIWEELKNLYHLLNRGLDVHPVLQIRRGSPVTIRLGPLKGMTGLVLRGVGRCRFVVKIDFLQAGAAVEINEADLELAEG